ncbi:TRAP transporter fused permease subunit [Natronospirillum operosum]|uniref:TRAP transporter fused permease subunit n=1 Tax=Natronospirillum operosum TaxID=2759953 RepID=A0A4Z0WI08_9GAMM|nr:TRAP transporter fused permease subunit [Natronospirillum operosum]TGG94260.1 TRAP transporter fused permease subunit [Natronospirillum operosum]
MSMVVRGLVLINQWVFVACAAALTLITCFLAFNLGSYFGISYYEEQFFALAVGCALFVAYHKWPVSAQLAPWQFWLRRVLDLVAAWGCLLVAGYFAWNFEQYSMAIAFRPPEVVIGGSLLLLAMLEAVRRIAGLPLLVIIVTIVAYGLWGSHLPSRFAAPSVNWDYLVTYITTDPSALLGMPVAVAVVVVLPFLFMGGLLSRSGGGQFFTDICLAVFRRSPGGPAKVSVVSSALLGSVSGSAVANVATSGVITIPMMKRAGVKPERAAATEAVASTGGQLIPPVMGAAAFLMAEFLQIPFATVVMAALIPATLFFVILFLNIHLLACRDGTGAIEPLDRTAWEYFRSGWYTFFGLILLFVLLIGFRWSPEMAAFSAAAFYAVCGLTLGYMGHKVRLREVLDNFRSTGVIATDVIIISAAAGVIIGVLNYSGLTQSLSRFLLYLSFDMVTLLVVYTAVASIILGMGMPTTGVYVLLAVLMAPALVQVGIEPLAAHFFIFYFGVLSMITPPVAIAAFSAASIGDARPMRTAVECVALGWPLFVLPFMMIVNPALLLTRGWGEGLLMFVLVVVSFAGIAAGSIGYWRGMLPPLYRLVLCLLGAAIVLMGFTGVGAGVYQWLLLTIMVLLLALRYLRPVPQLSGSR